MGFLSWIKNLLGGDKKEEANYPEPYSPPQEPMPKPAVEPRAVPECEFCGKKIGGVSGFRCLTCNLYFCADHAHHEDHSGQKPLQPSRFYGKCETCEKELTALEKTACPYCSRTLCHAHFPRENHDCRTRSKKPGGKRRVF